MPKESDQHRAFVKAARELGTDESEEVFDRMLGKLSKAPPPETVQQRKAAIERRKQLAQENRDAGKSAQKRKPTKKAKRKA